MSIALSQPYFLNWRYGGGKGFEYGRPVANSDEQCHLVSNTDGTYSVLSPNKDTYLSIQIDGSFQERTSSNAPGYWERFSKEGQYLIELPKDGVTRDLVRFIVVGDTVSTTPPSEPNRVMGPWSARDKFFYSDGNIVRVKGFTGFKVVNLYERGIDVRPFLNAYAGYNLVRVFLYTNSKDWGADAWGFPNKAAVSDFCAFAKDNGLQVHLCLCTDDDSSKIGPIKELVAHLKDVKATNVLLQAVNEPYVDFNGPLYGKLNPDEFKNTLTGSGFLYTSGIYTNNNKFWGLYVGDHSARSSDWWHKGGHNLYEFWTGGGPNDPSERALKVAAFQDEPIRPDQCNYDAIGFYSYAASCGMMGAGATMHTQSGKLCNLPTDAEAACIQAFLTGLNVYPLDAANGAYRRIVEPGQNDTARTYVMGNYSIRLGQQGTSHPESGWTSLDGFGVCWKR